MEVAGAIHSKMSGDFDIESDLVIQRHFLNFWVCKRVPERLVTGQAVVSRIQD